MVYCHHIAQVLPGIKKVMLIVNIRYPHYEKIVSKAVACIYNLEASNSFYLRCLSFQFVFKGKQILNR